MLNASKSDAYRELAETVQDADVIPVGTANIVDAVEDAQRRFLDDIPSAKLDRILAEFGLIGTPQAMRGRITPVDFDGQTINVINQKLGYLVRGGDPDAIDSIVPMAYGNLALDRERVGCAGCNIWDSSNRSRREKTPVGRRGRRANRCFLCIAGVYAPGISKT